MKILYDIALLGRGQAFIQDRTGLFRFAEETLKHLVADKELDLYFTTSQLNFDESEAYLKENFPKLADKLIRPKQFSVGNIFLSILKWTLGNIREAKIFPRTITKIDQHLGFLFEYFHIPLSLIPNSRKDFFELYFSPKYHIPKQITVDKKIRKVLVLHDMLPLLYPQYSPPSSKILYKSLIKNISNEMLIICNSVTTRNDFMKFRPDILESRVKVLPLSTSETFKTVTNSKKLAGVKSKYHIPLVARYIITVSSLNPRKNFPHVIKCFVAFIKQYNISDLYLVVTGPKGWDFADIFQTIDELGPYRDKIILTGFVDEVEMPALYCGAVASVCASLYEGFGYPALESMQCGTPAIVSNNSSLVEIVADAGIQIPPQDNAALIEALHKIYSDSNYRDSLAKAGIKRARNFNSATFAKNLSNLIKS